MSKHYHIGRFNLLMNDDHPLEEIQKKYPNYDKALGTIANLLWETKPGFTAIDVGANVGDSAALINNKYDIDVICAEGNKEYLSYLFLNGELFNSNIYIVSKFVNSIQEIFYSAFDYYDLKKVGLIKIDADGNDFAIIRNSRHFLRMNNPALYFEYFISQKFLKEESIKIIKCLTDIGYNTFLVWDNFGNFVTKACTLYEDHFKALNEKVDNIKIHYYDVLALKDNKELAERIIDGK